MPKIQVFAGHSDDEQDDNVRPPVGQNHGYVALSEVNETLRRIGLEYKQADYFPNRQVVIVIDPDPNVDPLPLEAVEKLKDLAHQLEAIGCNTRGISAQIDAVTKEA